MSHLTLVWLDRVTPVQPPTYVAYPILFLFVSLLIGCAGTLHVNDSEARASPTREICSFSTASPSADEKEQNRCWSLKKRVLC